VEEAQKKQANKRERRVLWWILATILLLSSLLVGVFFAGYCAHGDCIKKISSSQSPLSDTPAPSPFFSLKPFPPSFYFNEPTSSNVPSVSKNPGEVSPVGTTTIHNESPAYQTSKTAPPTTMAYRAIEIVEYVNRMRLFPYPIEYPPQSNTPEENALKWLMEIDPLQLDLNDRFRLIQRYALQTFMFSSPFSEPSKSTTFVDECDWFGVFCTNGVVTKIDFQDNSQLQFSIPYDLGLLISLQSINLQRTGLQGSIPDSIGNLKDLLYFNVAENNLSGTIPRNLAGCLNLWKAAFYSNALTGSVPSAICELDSIYEIVVDCTLECECCRCL
jgi:Leucine-rich repeat (LRR) protein